jgi:hypothetical protein
MFFGVLGVPDGGGRVVVGGATVVVVVVGGAVVVVGATVVVVVGASVDVVVGVGVVVGGAVVVVGGTALPTKRRRFGELLPDDVTTFGVAEVVSAVATDAGVSEGVVESNSAAAPATCGDAIDVPEMLLVADVLVLQADVMLEPGAKMSRQLPKFEYDARASVLVVAPTVSAVATRAGDDVQASTFELPAATTTVTPSAITR